MSRQLLAMVLVAASAACAAVRSQPDSAMISFAAKELSNALGPERAQVTIGTHRWLKAQGVAAPEPAGVSEAFTISRGADGSIVVAGHDEAGAMYGGIEAAEQTALAGIGSVKPMRAQPFHRLRQYKYNLPGLKSGQDYFHTEAYWRGLFDLLAKSRLNSIGFWHHHPFMYMIRYKRYPEAAVLTPEETERNIRTWRMVFRLARERNVSTFLINWNIHLPKPFASHHGIPDSGHDSPLVRAYMRYCIGATLRTYPNLTGLGACAGERMPSPIYDWREQWIKDTFLAGIKDSGRVVPLLHRYWWTAPDSVQRLIAADYAGEVILPLKYNGEHMYSGFRPHFLDPDWADFPDYLKKLPSRSKKKPDALDQPLVDHLEWITQTPRDYRIMWHLRNDCIFTFRWGDPDFARRVLRNAKADYSVGYLMGQERTRPGVERRLTDPAKAKTQWQYEYEPHWFRFMLWGRLGYDPTVPETRWRGLFRRRFGPRGDDLYTAYVATSRTIPTITRFHFNYMNGDWHPEWCDGGWNTGFGRGYNYRDVRPFHDVVEFVFNHTIEDRLLDIPEFVGLELRREPVPDGHVTPYQVADQLAEAGGTARQALGRIRRDAPQDGEAWDCIQEFTATAELASYYAEKIRGATELMFVFATGEQARRAKAVAHLRRAAEHWQRFAQGTSAHFRSAWRGPSYLPRVARDVILAQTAGSARDELQAAGVFQRAGERRHFDFRDLSDLLASKLAPAMDPLQQLGAVQITPATCDVLILGREAWAFHELAADKKRILVDAVERGVSLVLFFQNFPKFDTSWLPGGIQGADADANQFKWTQDHPIARGVDPSQLQGHAVVNDALRPGAEGWTSLTEPYGGLCVRKHGKGTIIFCQLDVTGRYREPAAARLIRNIVAFAAGDKKRPKLCMVDVTCRGTVGTFKKLGVRYVWIDDLPLDPSRIGR